jgi:hypothetical protein
MGWEGRFFAPIRCPIAPVSEVEQKEQFHFAEGEVFWRFSFLPRILQAARF